MSEKVLGVINAYRPGFPDSIHEYLFVTSDRVIVAGRDKGTLHRYAGLSPEDILKADRSNFAVTGSEVLEVQLEKGQGSHPHQHSHPGLRIILKKRRIHTRVHKKYECHLLGIAYGPVSDLDTDPDRWLPYPTSYRLESYEKLLLPVFGDKLSRRARDDSGLSERSIGESLSRKEPLSEIGFILVFGGFLCVGIFWGIATWLQDIGVKPPGNFILALIFLPIVLCVAFLLCRT